MFTKTRLAACVVAMVAFAAVPSIAGAATPQLRGVVSGSPYGASGGSMAVPVLFSKMTMRSAGLRSPVGVIILKRTQKVALPGGGTSLPVNLRTGDRFKGYGSVSATNKRTFYPRVPLTSKPQVYFRSKEMSLAELTAALQGLQDAFTKLKAQLDNLQTASIKAFQDLYAQLADLKKALAGLQGIQAPDFQSQIDALNKKLNDLIASLPDFSQFALASQLPDLSQYVKLSDLTTLLSGYATKTYVDNAIAGLQSQIDALPTAQEVTDAINSAINGLNISQYATTTYVDGKVATLKAKVNEMVGDFNTLCSQLDGLSALPVLQAAVSCPTLNTLP
jgi:prefoldin subunit 5